MSLSETPAQLRFVYMGDSITFGQHIDASVRWTAQLDRRLNDLLSPLGVTLRSDNRGVCGETTRGGLERFPQAVQEAGPEIMTLQYGMNDCNCWETDRGLPRVSPEAYRANLMEMIARARHFGAREIVLITNPVSLRRYAMPSGEAYDNANARYSAILRDVGQELGLPVADVRERFEGFSTADLADLLLPEPDLLHLSLSGHDVYADVVWPHVKAAAERVLGRVLATA